MSSWLSSCLTCAPLAPVGLGTVDAEEYARQNMRPVWPGAARTAKPVGGAEKPVRNTYIMNMATAKFLEPAVLCEHSIWRSICQCSCARSVWLNFKIMCFYV